ncbi:NAD-dependent epimerase/dehydratase family protein, partial [Microbacterium sp.]|uniref:NAD-dependent epimerase/dehydratase family protein n=1 Tax=Microbacterium sp. TaxID=51671 RepID=UPI002E483138|nr:hypothetical protein [Microbacterium sp.]
WEPQLKMIGLRFSNVIDPPDYAEFPSLEDDPASRMWNLWSYIDARDGAQAVVRALEYQTPGFDSFVIANHDNVMTRSSADLMAEFFPDTEFRSPVEGTRSLISSEKAQRLLGWIPQHTWRITSRTPEASPIRQMVQVHVRHPGSRYRLRANRRQD